MASTFSDPVKFTDRVNMRQASAVDFPKGGSAPIDRDNIVVQTPTIAIPLHHFRKASDYLHLPASAGGDFAIIAGTFGTDGPIIQGQSASSASVTDNCRVMIEMPPEYEEGTDITLRVSARVDVTVADAATIDAEAHELDRKGSVGSALVSEAAQDINSTTFADKDFTITGSDLVRGDVLDIQLTAFVDDTNGTNGGNAQIGAVEMLMDVRA